MFSILTFKQNMFWENEEDKKENQRQQKKREDKKIKVDRALSLPYHLT
jgi:hypothetical protein